MLHDLVGIGMRPPHYEKLTNEQANIGWLEVHSENHFEINSEATYYLDKACERYPLSLHGVGLSLASNELIDRVHVDNIKKLISRYNPFRVSEHLSWSSIAGQHYSELLPVPYTEQNLQHVISRINQVQQILEQEILIQNPACYTENKHNNLTETEFLIALQAETNCKILLDINNVHISSTHIGYDPSNYLNNIPASIVSEIHLSGCRKKLMNDKPIFTENHGHQITPAVWQLFEQYLQQSNTIPTLIEWDTNIPQLSDLLLEAQKARQMILKAKKFKQAS